jgi:transposase
VVADAGFEVCLVNARHVKHVPGRKSDVRDCQWLQYLHSVGLLRGSYRPAQAVCAARSVWRYRQNLVGQSARAGAAHPGGPRPDEPQAALCAR